MAHHIPTISTDDLLERIASGWRHAPAAEESARSAARRFERPATPRLTTGSRAGGASR